MSADSFFYAGLAGARAESLEKWMQHAADQEAQIQQLAQALQSWQVEAVENNALARYQKSALDVLGVTADSVLQDRAEQVGQETLEQAKNYYKQTAGLSFD